MPAALRVISQPQLFLGELDVWLLEAYIFKPYLLISGDVGLFLNSGLKGDRSCSLALLARTAQSASSTSKPGISSTKCTASAGIGAKWAGGWCRSKAGRCGLWGTEETTATESSICVASSAGTKSTKPRVCCRSRRGCAEETVPCSSCRSKGFVGGSTKTGVLCSAESYLSC